GLKAFHRASLVPIVHQCVIDKDLFASEFVVRAGRAGIHVVEIPVRVQEKRRPAINLARRVPNVLKNLVRLTYVIRVKR
ncbi:MAG TPA: glycosyltransferase family 2 protein, partial [Kofleriaceae bacterium]|nr:glycosyltransferase family 2 protein [Kofleriaceae bacterium]